MTTKWPGTPEARALVGIWKTGLLRAQAHELTWSDDLPVVGKGAGKHSCRPLIPYTHPRNLSRCTRLLQTVTLGPVALRQLEVSGVTPSAAAWQPCWGKRCQPHPTLSPSYRHHWGHLEKLLPSAPQDPVHGHGADLWPALQCLGRRQGVCFKWPRKEAWKNVSLFHDLESWGELISHYVFESMIPDTNLT